MYKTCLPSWEEDEEEEGGEVEKWRVTSFFFPPKRYRLSQPNLRPERRVIPECCGGLRGRRRSSCQV